MESGRHIFDSILALIPKTSTRRCLQVVCWQPGMEGAEIELLACGQSIGDELRRLEELCLVVNVWGRWVPTWLGVGVFNWAEQLVWADLLGEPAPEPRPFENGNTVAPGCDQFRYQFASGNCWCGRGRKDHADQAVKAAESLLRRSR